MNTHSTESIFMLFVISMASALAACSSSPQNSAAQPTASGIPAVTVEIPAIPEDEEQARRALVELDRLGLARLNLHQLFAIRATLTRMARRGYLFLRPPFQEAPVVQSELTALRLILFALENEFDITIPDDEVRNVRNVRQMVEGVDRLVAAKTAPADPAPRQ